MMKYSLAVRAWEHRLGKWQALTWAQRRLLFTCAACLPLFWLGLRVLGLARFQARLNSARISDREPLIQREVEALGELVNIAARCAPVPSSCLSRALLLGWLLRRRGTASHMRIGTRLVDGKLLAHAWIECGGVAINEPADVALVFRPLESVKG